MATLVINPFGAGPGTPPGSRDTSLLSTYVTGVVFEIDATISASYSGTGQDFLNRETSPADGSAQSAYDFYLGATSGSESSDPTFTGTADNLDAYFACDGGDFFTLKGANTTFIQNLHKSTGGNAFTFILAGRPPTQSTTNQAMMGTRDGTNHGISFFHGLNPSSNNKFGMAHTGSTTQNVDFAGFPTTADGTDRVTIITFDPATRALKGYSNSNTVSTGTFPAFTSTSNPGTQFNILARGNGVLPALSGYRFRAAAMLNKVISDSEAQTIVDRYKQMYGW